MYYGSGTVARTYSEQMTSGALYGLAGSRQMLMHI